MRQRIKFRYLFVEAIRYLDSYLQRRSPSETGSDRGPVFTEVMGRPMQSELEAIDGVLIPYWTACLQDESGRAIKEDDRWHEQFDADVASARIGFLQTDQGSVESARAEVRQSKIRGTNEYSEAKEAHAALENARRTAEYRADQSVRPTHEGYDLNRVDELAGYRLESERYPIANTVVIEALRELPNADPDQATLRVAIRHMLQYGNLNHYHDKLPLIDAKKLTESVIFTFRQFGTNKYILLPDGTIETGSHDNGQVFDLAASKYAVTTPSKYSFIHPEIELQEDVLRPDIEAIVAEVQTKANKALADINSPEHLNTIKADIRTKIEANIAARDKAREITSENLKAHQTRLQQAEAALAQVNIDISDEEIAAQQERAFRRHLPKVIAYALTNPNAVGPQMLVFPNPKPPDPSQITRGFGGTVSTGETTGNIYLHFNGDH